MRWGVNNIPAQCLLSRSKAHPGQKEQDWTGLPAISLPVSSNSTFHPPPKPKEPERARSCAQPVPPTQISGHLCPSQDNAPQLPVKLIKPAFFPLDYCSVVTTFVFLMYWSLLFLSNKNGSKLPKRRKQKDACWQGCMFIVFAVWNQACSCSTLLRTTCMKQNGSCSLLRTVWNFAPLRDEKQKVFKCEGGQGL